MYFTDYIAPEAYVSKSYDYRIDLYSLGAIIYFILSKINPTHFMFDFSKIKDKFEDEYCDKMISIIQNLTSIDPLKRFSILEIVKLFDGDFNLVQDCPKNEMTQETIQLKVGTLGESQKYNQPKSLNNQIEKSFGTSENLEDKEIILEKKKRDPLQFAREELHNDKDFVLKAVKQNGISLKFALKKHQNDKEIVLEAVKQNGDALQYASKELQNDKEIVLQTMKQNGRALEFASKELQNDKEVVLEAVKKEGFALEYASEELQNDREIVLEAVKRYGLALEYTSEKLQNDKEIVLEAVKNDEGALEYASKEIQNDKEIVLIAVKMDANALEYASKELQNDKEIFLEIVKKYGDKLKTASKELQNDKEIVLEAVKNDGGALEYASKELQNNKEFIMCCFKYSKFSLIHSSFFNDETFCHSLIKESIENFNYISPLLKLNENFLLKCLEENFNVFIYFDSTFKNNQEFILKAIVVDVGCLKFISEDLKKDFEFAMQLVQCNGNCLEHLSKELRNNIEIVKCAVETTEDSYKFASSEIQYLGDSKVYETIKKIAEGGEGMIYLVKKKEKFFAEKRIKTNDFHEMNLLFSEYSTIFTLRHENIFKIQEILQDDNEITGFTLIRVIMELYDGDLFHFIETFEINENLIVQFGIQILNGLKYLHSNGIIHGDLKLENIFYLKNENGIQLKIGDFGTNNIKNYEFYGSILNIAPEVIVEKLKHSEKSDIFSFGGILLRMMNSTDRVLYVDSLERNIHFDEEKKFNQELKELVINLLSPVPQERMNIDEILKKLKDLK
jgi:serine/threonine protein kinase/CxxC motif-containing protein